MGVFLALASVIGKSQNEVVSSLANYARSVNGGLQQQDNIDSDTPNACIVQEENGNTSILFPDEFMEWDSCAQFISQDLGAAVFSFHIHDGDFWMYILFDKGAIVDQFNPVPDYWDEDISDAEIRRLKGNAKTISRYIPYIKVSDIDRYLVRWEEDEEPAKAYPTDEFEKEDWQLNDFMKKLRLPYPVDDNGQPKGQTYLLWTDKMRLTTKQAGHSSKATGKSNKPWWKFWLIGLAYFTSCDCVQRVNGIVIDHETGKPVSGATVHTKNKEWNTTVTDSTGHFELSNISGGCFRCPPMNVVIEKNSYIQKQSSIVNNGHKTIDITKAEASLENKEGSLHGYWKIISAAQDSITYYFGSDSTYIPATFNPSGDEDDAIAIVWKLARNKDMALKFFGDSVSLFLSGTTNYGTYAINQDKKTLQLVFPPKSPKKGETIIFTYELRDEQLHLTTPVDAHNFHLCFKRDQE